MNPTLKARPHPWDGVSWIVEARDRSAARWLKRHGPADAVRFHGNPWARLVIPGSQLIELIARARADKITFHQS